MNSPLKAHVLLIGNELLSGRIADTNGQSAAKILMKNGIKLTGISVIPDVPEIMIDAFRDRLNDNDILITSGGIGPTKDDLTKPMLAECFNKKLIEREDVAEIVRGNYTRFGREWTPSLNSYHVFPEDFIALKNEKGLAPGLAFFSDRNAIFSLPGVPRELNIMLEEEVLPHIFKKWPKNASHEYMLTCRTFGIPEEKIFGELAPELWDKLEKIGGVGSYPQIVGVDIVVTVFGDEKQRELKFMEMKEVILASKIKDYIWQWGDLPLPELVLQKAREKKLTIALAESCSGGLSASRLTDVAGSSDVFLGAAVTYANSAKESILKVQSETIKSFGAVSEETAREMALGARELYRADLTVSTTGIAGPGGGSPEKPVGTVCFAIASKNGVKSEKHKFPGDRVRLKIRFSEYALLMLLKEIDHL